MPSLTDIRGSLGTTMATSNMGQLGHKDRSSLLTTGFRKYFSPRMAAIWTTQWEWASYFISQDDRHHPSIAKKQ